MQITDEHERQTIETYDKNAELWAQDHGMEDSFRLLELFKASLPSGSVLEVGAGSGYDGKMLSDAGYVYTGTDASKGMVELASKKYPELSFSQLSIYNLKELNKPFDGIWASAVLLHLPRRRVGEALEAFSRVLRDGGAVLITLKDGDREEFEVRDINGRHEERIFTFWTKEAFTVELEKYGFKVVGYSYSPKSERSQWHNFVAQKGR